MKLSYAWFKERICFQYSDLLFKLCIGTGIIISPAIICVIYLFIKNLKKNKKNES
ncbi:MAG: hypothetical protein PWQ15_1875 [Methanobacterium sp.]|jgi:hypothetical protein|nr:hypothetical protein [Methanobacterium sp.]